MKREPSVLAPANAKNASPGFTARLSTARPVTASLAAAASITVSSLKRSRSFIIFQSREALICLLRCFRCRKNKAVGRRQIETRLDSQEWRDAGDHGTTGRHRIPARGDEAVG